LIDKGAQVEARNINGSTPLHYAARYGRVEIVRLLCNRGADADARNYAGLRPLHTSAFFGQISIVKELIEERNAEINARTDDNWRTATSLARLNNNDEIAAYLDSHGGR
jgi:ankyrin repeat protein